MEKNFFRTATATAAGQKFFPSELRILPPLFLGMRKVVRKGGEIASKAWCELSRSMVKFLQVGINLSKKYDYIFLALGTTSFASINLAFLPVLMLIMRLQCHIFEC